MADFQFLKNFIAKKWVIWAPRRSKRTNVGKKPEAVCPFCIGREADEEELYRVGGQAGDSNWHIRVIPNKFPFAPHHEIIIHSPDHHKNIDELPFSQVELIFQTYRQRYNVHAKLGPHFAKASWGKQVYIFHNRGIAAGESLPHPHTQLVVIPGEVTLEIPVLDYDVIARREKRATRQSHAWKRLLRSFSVARNDDTNDNVLETEHFLLFCPKTSEWPDEVWIAPQRSGTVFGQITDKEITDLAFALTRIIQIFDLRHQDEFPFNFYVYPGKNWYLRLIPRIKILGGFEVGTQVMVNTQDPKETFAFIKEHFWQPDHEKIKSSHQAEYYRRA